MDPQEHDEILEFVESKLLDYPITNRLIIGQDRNAKVGVLDAQDHMDARETIIGKFGDPFRNVKGENVLSFHRALTCE